MDRIHGEDKRLGNYASRRAATDAIVAAVKRSLP